MHGGGGLPCSHCITLAAEGGGMREILGPGDSDNRSGHSERGLDPRARIGSADARTIHGRGGSGGGRWFLGDRTVGRSESPV